MTPEGCSSIGRVPVSKTVGCEFKSRQPCVQPESLQARTTDCVEEECVTDVDNVPDDSSDKSLAKSSRAVDKSTDKGKDKKAPRKSLFSRIALFFRQTVAELRKVIWPTRKELVSYTWVVLVFVLIMGTIIGVLDFVFAKGVLAVFG